MASQSEWKNPNEIMKTHRMQRHPSFNLAKSKSTPKIGISRRHSFTVLSQTNNNSPSPRLRSSLCDTSIHVQETGSQKRKNPFGCNITSSLCKRRSVFSEDIPAENHELAASSQTVTSPCDASLQQSGSDRETEISTEIKPNRLLSALIMQEKKDLDRLLLTSSEIIDVNESVRIDVNGTVRIDVNESLRTDVNESLKTDVETPLRIDGDLFVKHHPDVLKEKPATLNTTAPSKENRFGNNKVCSSPPPDWSLKSKARVTVHTSVSSFKKHPGTDAKNMDSYVQHKLDNSPEWKDLDIVQQMKRCCMHYSYPHMPWLSTFPRLSSDFKSRSPSVIANSREVLESLQKDWSSAFTSIYQQLQGGLCPYFYVCAYQFSVLFRCQRSQDSTSWSALLSPSTRGLREILTKEGIPFRMPNIRSDRPGGGPKQKGNGNCSKNESEALPSSQTDQDTQDAADENSQKENTSRDIADKPCKSGHDDSSDDDIDGDDEASRWLEGMGLDRKDFPSLEPCKVKLQREGFREIDNRPQSLVYVEGVDVHSFFNFLLNYPSCIASSGPQHGIPPTILSPVSFVGGRLVQNMVKHTTLSDGMSHVGSQPDGSRNKCTHVFEISGPLLPHHALNIASILHNSPECETSSVSFSTHAPSAAFNTQTQHNAEKDKLAVGLSKLFVDLSQANPGLLQDVRQQLLASPVLGTASAVREMYIQKSGYLWTC